MGLSSLPLSLRTRSGDGSLVRVSEKVEKSKMRPPARCGRAQRKCEQYLDVLTVHTHSRNIPLRCKGFFDRKALGGLQ